MSANLYPGIKSLHLVLDTPYDQIRTDDVRDDLVGVKVWYSSTQGFDPTNSQGTLAFDGLSQSITISDLAPNTRYYVRYAFISAIDPTTFTVSQELTEQVLDDAVSVYGYLTNDPTAIATNADGSGGDYSLTQGVFKVYDSTQDVTGTGPVYAIVPNTSFGGIQASINPTTGAYYATALSAEAGSITFSATYNNIEVVKVWNLLKTSAGSDAPSLRINSTGNSFIFKDESATTSTGTITVSSVLQNITGTPTYTAVAYTREGTLLGPVEFSISGNSITITSEQFNNSIYANQVGNVLITSTLGSVSDTFSIYRINDGSEQITVEQSNQAHTIPAFENGVVAEGDYEGSGNIIKVKQGNSYLPVDNSSPYVAGSWRITSITSSGITADPSPTIGIDYVNFDTHSAMVSDVAYIDYTITGTSTTGKSFTIVVRQSFSKSKAGVKGSDAPIVTLTATNQVFTVLKNTGTITPNSANITATPINIVNPVYSWTVDGVVQSDTDNIFSLSSFTGNPKLVKVIVTGDGGVSAFDQMTIFSLREGDDSIQAGLINENQTVSCDSAGEPIAGQLPLSSELVVVRGTEVLDAGVVYSKVSESGMVSTINASTGIISVTSITADFGTATYRATVGSTVLDKVFTVNKAKNGAAGAPGAAGTPGASAPSADISGLTTFYRNTGQVISPATATLTAISHNVTSPGYSWTITGATPTSATGSTVTITPTGANTTITVTLSITGSNLQSPIILSRGTNIVDQGATGQGGQNGIMSAYPTIYQWTSGSEPARPTTTSTYTWSTGSYTAPTNWSISAPSNTTPGWVLWEITVPVTVEATVATSTLDWTNTNYIIRATTYNGSNGTDGTNGTNGANGSATYLINRGASGDGSAPTSEEVQTAIGRYAQQGDIATVSYNSASNSTAYRATTSGSSASWALQTSYITGSLIVQNSISGDRIIANSLTVDKITSGATDVNVTNVNGQTVTGSFKLGSGDRTPLGNTAAIGTFTCSTSTGWALAGFNTNTSTDGSWGNGILAGTSSPTGIALGAYSVSSFSTSYTNLKSAAILAETGAGTYGMSLKPSTWNQTARENNLSPDYSRSRYFGAVPNYGLTAIAFGTSANISGSIKLLGATDFNNVVNYGGFGSQYAGTLSASGGAVNAYLTVSAGVVLEVGAYIRKVSGTAVINETTALITSKNSSTTYVVYCASGFTGGSLTFVQGHDDLGVTSAELAYCSDDQSLSAGALFIRRHASGANKGYEASRVVIAPSWNPTRAVEASGGGTYTGTVGHFPGGITSFTGVHEAQSNQELLPGNIVLDSRILHKEDVANVFSEIINTTIPKDTRVFGVVAHYYENQSIPLVPDDISYNLPEQGFMPSTIEVAKEVEPWKLKYTVLVNGVGEGQINVCGENGNISAGDLIVSSSIPGKGMKQDDDIIRSYTVAKARESVTFSSATEVKMIACTYLCG